jgi:two-component system chemotaxis response regulator CheB
MELVSTLPADFPAAIAVVQHRGVPSDLARMLGSYTPLPVRDARMGDRLLPGNIYVAPPVHHMWVNPNRSLYVASALKIRAMRPSADLLINSVAVTYRKRAIGVILSGMLDDGAAGAYTIKHMGGCIIAEDAATALAPDMPSAAIATGSVDFILPVNRIAAALITLVMAPGAAAFFQVSPAPVSPLM